MLFMTAQNTRFMSPLELTDWIDQHPLSGVMGLCVDESLLDLTRKNIVSAQLINGHLVFSLNKK